jgi:hypothetical protein
MLSGGKMQSHFKLFAVASVLAFAVMPAFAVQTTTMKVQGKVIAALCDITMPEGSVSDFSNMTDADLQNVRPTIQFRTSIKSKQLSVAISCKGDTTLAIKVTDNNAASRPSGESLYRSFFFNTVSSDAVGLVIHNWLGLGFASNGARIGAYSISFGKISVDSTVQPMAIVGTGEGDWQVPRGGRVFF